MDCNEVRRRLMQDGAEIGDAEQAHLSECAACGALFSEDGRLARALDGAVQAAPADSGLLDQVQRSLGRDRGAVASLRGLSTTTRLVLALVVWSAAAVASGLQSLRPDLGLYPMVRFVLELLALASVALLGGWAWLRPLHRPALPARAPVVLLTFALLLPWVLAALPQAHLLHPASVAGTGDDLWPRALACFLYGSIVGLPVAILVGLMGRGGQSLLAAMLLPATTGALGGLVGLHLHCPITAPEHLLAGHAPVAAALALLALAVRGVINVWRRGKPR